MKVLGLISGTSHDGVDVAVVDFALHDGVLHGTVGYTGSTPYPDSLRERLMRALPPAPLTFGEACVLDTLIGQAFADVAVDAVERAGPIDLICSHGQTVYHWTQRRLAAEGGTPTAGRAASSVRVLGTLQLGQPAWIAERTGTPVVADVRIRDIASGGQGAPLVAMMDTMLLADLPGRPAGLNLGGIANITVLGNALPVAYDTGPSNALIDASAIRATAGRLHYDVDGKLAAAGAVHSGLLAHLLAEPYYAAAPPKTTGKELFNADYLDDALVEHPGIAEVDVVATVTALTAETVATEVRRHAVDTVVVSGGGFANPTLMAMLADRVPGVRLMSTAEFGAPPESKEAIAFALVGWHTAHGLAGNAPSCTGAVGGRVLGAIVPGSVPLRLPEPLRSAPTVLRLSGAS